MMHWGVSTATPTVNKHGRSCREPRPARTNFLPRPDVFRPTPADPQTVRDALEAGHEAPEAADEERSSGRHPHGSSGGLFVFLWSRTSLPRSGLHQQIFILLILSSSQPDAPNSSSLLTPVQVQQLSGDDQKPLPNLSITSGCVTVKIKLLCRSSLV